MLPSLNKKWKALEQRLKTQLLTKTLIWSKRFLPLITTKIDDILNKLYIYRLQIKGDFEQKVEAMNKVTENLIKEHD